jgi:hypothetical protein
VLTLETEDPAKFKDAVLLAKKIREPLVMYYPGEALGVAESFTFEDVVALGLTVYDENNIGHNLSKFTNPRRGETPLEGMASAMSIKAQQITTMDRYVFRSRMPSL